MRRAAQQARDQAARADERRIELLGDDAVLAGGVVDRAQQRAVLGVDVDERGDHRLHDGLGLLGLDALDAVDQRVVRVGQQVGGELGEVG